MSGLKRACVCSTVLFALGLVALPTVVYAEEGVPLTAEVLTEAPVLMGVSADVEIPYRFQFRLGVGYLPAPYVGLINNVVQAFDDTYTDSIATLVENTLQNSLVLRLHAGWRPFADYGFYFHTGYTFAGLGGGTSALELIEGLAGISLPDSERQRGGARPTVDFEVASVLHMVDIELGWRFALSKVLSLRVALGWSYTFAASTTDGTNFSPVSSEGQAALTELEEFAIDFLNDTYTSFVHPPAVTAAFGYRFDL